MQVTASFTESDLTALKAGQPAKVTVSAIDADLTGHALVHRPGRVIVGVVLGRVV